MAREQVVDAWERCKEVIDRVAKAYSLLGDSGPLPGPIAAVAPFLYRRIADASLPGSMDAHVTGFLGQYLARQYPGARDLFLSPHTRHAMETMRETLEGVLEDGDG